MNYDDFDLDKLIASSRRRKPPDGSHPHTVPDSYTAVALCSEIPFGGLAACASRER